jgi:hypothetical protein
MAKGRRQMPGGGMNMNALMKQAQQMQKKMEVAQQEAETKEFEATAGGGAITIRVNGKKQLLDVKIDPDLLDPEEVEMIQDLILVAVNDALTKAEEAVAAEMGKVTGGMPGMF